MGKLIFRIKHFFQCTCKLWEKPAFKCPDCGKRYRCYYSGNDCSCGTIHLCNRCAKKHMKMGHHQPPNKEMEMFSIKEKMAIADAVEKVLLELNHPEMPDEKPVFTLHVDGKESWSFADIEPNWSFDGTGKVKRLNGRQHTSYKR